MDEGESQGWEFLFEERDSCWKVTVLKEKTPHQNQIQTLSHLIKVINNVKKLGRISIWKALPSFKEMYTSPHPFKRCQNLLVDLEFLSNPETSHSCSEMKILLPP